MSRLHAIALGPSLRELPILLRGETGGLQRWIREQTLPRALVCVGVIVLGAGVYGAAIGSWRSPWQAFYTAVKFPLILLLTTLGNALVNAMLAPLLGLNLPFRQSLLAVLMSFTIVALILGAFSPMVWFLILNLPALETGVRPPPSAYALLLLSQVGVIALAGVAGNVRLVHLLEEMGGSALVARKVLAAWLGVNMILGTQLTWILRPFFGAPHLPVEFLRADALDGNFFEAVYFQLRHFLSF